MNRRLIDNNSSQRLRRIKLFLIDYNEILKSILLDLNGINTKKYEHYLWNIISRYRYNIEGVIPIIPLVINDSRIKMSLNLILRSIASDIITSYYLMCFYDNKKAPTIALRNELDILSTEHIIFLKGVKDIELDRKKSKVFEDELINLQERLFNNDGKIKNKKELRKTSEDVYLEILKEFNSGKFITEQQKIDTIKKISPNTDLKELYARYKYYSQFQHFNLMSKRIIENDLTVNIESFDIILRNLVESIEYILLISDLSNKKHIKELKRIMYLLD